MRFWDISENIAHHLDQSEAVIFTWDIIIFITISSIHIPPAPEYNLHFFPLADNISWQEAVRSQKILEFVLTEFANLDETYCAQLEGDLLSILSNTIIQYHRKVNNHLK